MSTRCHYCNYQVSDGKYLCDPVDPNICKPCQKLSELEEKIQSAKKALIRLVKEHQKLKEQVNYNHDRLIQHLPPEICGYIFELCFPGDAMGIDLQHMTSTAKQSICAPLILSSVCRRWRSIAHSAPQLWTTLLLYQKNALNSLTLSESSIKEWIDRAGVLPLSISFYASTNPEAAIQIMNLLKQYADRWIRLKYQGPSSLLCFSKDGRELPLLQTLHITDPHCFGSYTLDLNPKRLKMLSIIGLRLGSVQFDLHYLVQLEMGYPSLLDCFEALRRAPRLIRCTWSDEESKVREESPLPRNLIVHSNIRHLEFIQTLLYKKIFEYLSCPSLTTLVLDFTRDPVDIPRIIGFLSTSECPLERLSLVHADLSTSDLVSLCEGMVPALQHLDIGFLTSTPVPKLFELLAEFTIVNGRKVPLHLPALRSLALDTDTIHNWRMLPRIFGTPTDHFSTDIERHRHALESVAISVSTRFDSDLVSAIAEETLKRIVSLREAGVKWDLRSKENKEDIIELAIDWYVWDVGT